ncbi:MAG: very short patch repair endonuclease [Chloroflexi bacterium]|jgi:DNA mismatch endonuclease (patch repair protein)|nr:very short patch repair endonuclease [Chloroflexota bacterium]
MSSAKSDARPPPSSEQVSQQMKRMPRKNSGPEVRLRRELHSRGLRFRVNLRGLPGTPDIAFTRAKIAVFVDGCFWHRCPEHGVLPKANRDWWREKLDRNVERDRRKDGELEDLGWLSIHVWEHDDPSTVADGIEQAWRVERPA